MVETPNTKILMSNVMGQGFSVSALSGSVDQLRPTLYQPKQGYSKTFIDFEKVLNKKQKTQY